MPDSSLLALTFAIGIVAGLRSLTPVAVVCWSAHRGWIDIEGSRLALLSSTAATAVMTLLAVGELIADKLPFIPSRRSLVPLTFRILTGAFSAAILARGWYESWHIYAAVGAVGAVAGTFGGYEMRTRSVKALKVPDFVVAVAEDCIAIGAAVLIAHSMVI